MTRRRQGSFLLCCAVSLIPAFSCASPPVHCVNYYQEYRDAPFPITDDSIKNYVYFARDRDAMRGAAFLDNPRFDGAQIMYTWSTLEPEKGSYDFMAIDDDLRFLASHGKRLFVQLQDASFSPEFKAVPAYLLTDEYDCGAILQRNERGEPDGWVAKRWNTGVRERFAELLVALGREFDGKVEGICLQETSIGVTHGDDPTLSGAVYAAAIRANMLALKRAFPISVTMQYANFMCDEWLPEDDKGYLRSIYAYGEEIGVGLGAPDLMIAREEQLNHPLAMMREGSFTVPLGIAVQDGNYIGETDTMRVVGDHENLVPILYEFARDFLRADYIFWSFQEPYFTRDVLPAFPRPGR